MHSWGRGRTEDGETEEVGAELAQHIKPRAKREAQSYVPESLSHNLERWSSLCCEDGARKKENKDRKTNETYEDI